MNTAVRVDAEPDAGGLQHILAMQRQAAQREGAPGLTQRLTALKAVRDLVQANKDPLARAISADFGSRAVQETMLAEVVPILAAIRHTTKHLARWMLPERRRVGLNGQPGRAWVQVHPLGCVGVVSPWNYPIFLTLGPLVDALGAGNRVMLKPSELTPRFAALLARLLADAFDPVQVCVVQGGPDVAAAFCALPFDHLVFTGSTEVGRKVMLAAAANLVPVTLELGGKSPVIVAPDYNTAAAAKTVAVAKFFNAGQTCIAPDYALVPADTAERFAHAVLDQARKMYPVAAGNPDVTSIITDRHYARLQALAADAQAADAEVLRLEDAPAERKMGATVVLHPPLDGSLMQDEIFGPILPVIGYQTVAEAIAFVNARPRPLALYPFSRDPATLRAILSGAISGGASVNTALLHCAQEDIPFGGIGPSGTGAYHGHDGFRRLSHTRAVYQAGPVSGLTMLTPPWGRAIRIVLKTMLAR